MKTVLLAVLLVTLVHADPPFPKWAQHFQQQFVESYVDAPHFHTEGFMWYDATLQMSRIQRNNGKMDRVCGSVLNASTPCEQLVRDGKRYVIYNFIQVCCLCCTSEHGCGFLKPDWPSQGFKYVGKDEIDGEVFDKFRNEEDKTGYWVTQEEQIPRKISELDKYYRDQYEHTYRELPIPDSIFALPKFCNGAPLCPADSKCGQFRGERPMTE